jgi:hypothetical protein
MKKTVKLFVIMLLGAGLLIAFPGQIFGENKVPKANLPILTTSGGQSADINTLNAIFEEAEIGFDYCDVPTLEMIKAGVGLNGAKSGKGFHVEYNTDKEKYKDGTPYKSIFFAIGASLKGMGASGLTIEDEIKRVKGIIDYCKKEKIFVVAVHVGGISKRGASGSDNERMIDAVAPFADFIIAVKDSNKDGRFNKISQISKVPFIEVKNALEVIGILNKMYQ